MHAVYKSKYPLLIKKTSFEVKSFKLRVIQYIVESKKGIGNIHHCPPFEMLNASARFSLLNPSKAEGTFGKSARTQIFLKTI